MVLITYFELRLRFLFHTLIETKKKIVKTGAGVGGGGAGSTLHLITVHRTLHVQILSIALYTRMIYGVQW